MCWTCNINKLKAQIAKEDINVYKIATKKYCISPFMDYTYYSKNIQPSLTLGVILVQFLQRLQKVIIVTLL